MGNIVKLNTSYENSLGLPVIEYVDVSIFSKPYPAHGCLKLDCRDICCSGGAIMDIAAFQKLVPYRSE